MLVIMSKSTHHREYDDSLDFMILWKSTHVPNMKSYLITNLFNYYRHGDEKEQEIRRIQ